MAERAVISLIVPTRRRPLLLQAFLHSVAATAAVPENVEVVLVIDGDDSVSQEITCERLRIRRVVVGPGQTMGALNTAGYEASTGRYLMLLNDDVLARSPAWDTSFRTCFDRFPDEVLLLHVNDRLFESVQCTFPVVSRRFCKLVGGICPTEYVRYRIDDHIEDIFNLLSALGERRTVYLPNVVFEHGNYAVDAEGVRRYQCDSEKLSADAELFTHFLPQRKALTLRLMEHLHGGAPVPEWRSRLEMVTDSFALRRPEWRRHVRGTGAKLREESASERWLRRLGAKLQTRLTALMPSWLWRCWRSGLVSGPKVNTKNPKTRFGIHLPGVHDEAPGR